ncbi:MoaD/ThiS family protein [Geoglobus sp.]
MVRVRLFANFREIAGTKELEVEAASLSELLEILRERYPEFEKLYEYAIIMVNRKSVSGDVKLEDGDEVALLPPVSGG